MNVSSLLLFVHVLATVVWVGGMFFAHMVLRPTALEVLEAPPLRLSVWAGVFRRFFPWVWVAGILIPASGAVLFARAGFAGAPISWHIMMATGSLMVAIYCYIFFVPYAAFRRAAAAQKWPDAGAALNRIRPLVATNLTLGLITIAVATLGRGF